MTTQSLINQSNQLVFLSADDEATILLNSTNDAFVVTGNDDLIYPSFGNLPNVDIIQDLAQGLALNLSLGGQYTVYGFGNDATGQVDLNKQLAAPVLAPDGSGGTMVTGLNGAGSFADFVGDPSMAVSGGPGAWRITSV